MTKKYKAPKDLAELGYGMAEIWADLKNGEITPGEAKAYSGVATTMVKIVVTQMDQDQMLGITRKIDFTNSLQDNPSLSRKQINLKKTA